MPQSKQGQILSLQYLRVVAAFGVVLFHAGHRGGLPFTIGAAGVDVFFVISGVIMWTVTQAKSPRPADFLLSRVTRIAPAYVLLTLAVAALALAAPALLPGMKVTFAHVAQSLLFIPHVDPDGLAYPLIVAGWTLNYEMFFYVLFATALLLPRGSRVWWCTGLIGGLTAIGAVAHVPTLVGQTFTDSIMLEFLAGIWIGAARTQGLLPRRAAGWAALIAGAAWFASAAAVPGAWGALPRIVTWGMPAALLVAGALTVEARGGVGLWRTGLVFGDTSYSIYLVHALVVSAAWRLIVPAAGAAGYGLVLFMVASMAGSAVLGWAFSRVVEVPLTRILRSRRPARPHPVHLAVGTSQAAG